MKIHPPTDCCARAQRRSCGFTLAESALALAVTGFALATLLALLPSALELLSDARHERRAVQIAQEILAPARATSRDGLARPVPAGSFRAREDGALLAPDASSRDVLYRGTLLLEPGGGGGGDSAGIGTLDASLRIESPGWGPLHLHARVRPAPAP